MGAADLQTLRPPFEAVFGVILNMQKRLSRQLSFAANNPVIALDEKEAAKIFSGDTSSDIGSEAGKMKFTNAVNSLVVTFIPLDYDEANKWDLLAMERLYALDYSSMDIEKHEWWMDVFEDEIKQLHAAGFVHRDIKRPSKIKGDRFDNVFLTANGIRLIDVGISARREQVGSKLFAKYGATELEDMGNFKEFFF